MKTVNPAALLPWNDPRLKFVPVEERPALPLIKSKKLDDLKYVIIESSSIGYRCYLIDDAEVPLDPPNQ